MYPTLLFDMDGTLIDSADGVFQSLRYAMESVGGPELPRGAVRHFLGTPIERVLQTRFGCDAQTALLVRERFLNHYRDHGLYATVPVPGMVELTARLKTAGFRLAIATCNYPQTVAGCNGRSTLFDGIAFQEDGDGRDMCSFEAPSQEGVYLTSLDLDALRAYRRAETWGNAYRRPRKYQELIREEIREPFIREDYRG